MIFFVPVKYIKFHLNQTENKTLQFNKLIMIINICITITQHTRQHQAKFAYNNHISIHTVKYEIKQYNGITNKHKSDHKLLFNFTYHFEIFVCNLIIYKPAVISLNVSVWPKSNQNTIMRITNNIHIHNMHTMAIHPSFLQWLERNQPVLDWMTKVYWYCCYTHMLIVQY